MSYADQLFAGMMNALELELADVAEALARVLARHVRETGEFPSALPPEELLPLVDRHARTQAFGPS